MGREWIIEICHIFLDYLTNFLKYIYKIKIAFRRHKYYFTTSFKYSNYVKSSL